MTYNIDIEAKRLWSTSPKGFVFNGSETNRKTSADWMLIDIYSCTIMHSHVSCHWLVRSVLRLNANLSILKQKTDSGSFYQLAVVEIFIRSRSWTWMPNNLPSPQRNTGSRPSCPLSMLNFWVAIWVFPKIGGKPQIIHSNRVFPYKPSSLGYHYFWKHPYTWTSMAGHDLYLLMSLDGTAELQP